MVRWGIASLYINGSLARTIAIFGTFSPPLNQKSYLKTCVTYAIWLNNCAASLSHRPVTTVLSCKIVFFLYSGHYLSPPVGGGSVSNVGSSSMMGYQVGISGGGMNLRHGYSTSTLHLSSTVGETVSGSNVFRCVRLRWTNHASVRACVLATHQITRYSPDNKFQNPQI